MKMRFIGCCLLVFNLLGVVAEAPARDPIRVVRPDSTRQEAREDESRATQPMAAPSLKPVTPPPATPRAARPSLLEPQLTLEGLGPTVVASFQPQETQAEEWRLTVSEVEGYEVAVMSGQGSPPERILWDGRLIDGGLAWPGMAYTYTFSATDSGGLTRHFEGEVFSLPAYVRQDVAGVSVLFAGRDLGGVGSPEEVVATSPRLQRVADMLDQRAAPTDSLRIEVLARDEERARVLGLLICDRLMELVECDERHVEVYAGTAPAAPVDGTVLITTVTPPHPDDLTP